MAAGSIQSAAIFILISSEEVVDNFTKPEIECAPVMNRPGFPGDSFR
jgi:hypothetical protein